MEFKFFEAPWYLKFILYENRQVQKSDRINLDRSPWMDIKNDKTLRNHPIALISKLILVKSAQTSNSFGLENRFLFDLR